MKKILLFLAVTVLLLILVLLALKNEPSDIQQVIVTDYKDATYVIDGTPATLVDGVSEKIPKTNSPVLVTTRYFGNQLFKDINDDGRDDVIFFLTQETGGSGSFFYVVAAVNTDDGYIGSEALFLGDRIAPQTIESGIGNQIVVNYTERAAGEPMTTSPSIGVSRRLILDVRSMQFTEVAADFEREADVNYMALGMKTWVWQKTEFDDGRIIFPTREGVFTLLFADDHLMEVGTDCNNVGGEYTVENNKITFTNLRSTLMYCEDSQEAEFLEMLKDTKSFHFTTNGELFFDLKDNNGTVVLH
ncbi:META domain-containing protein [Candidatus Parcubacteria bacterium]|nr:META domain-containing protein [Candidatus Parcubacteria bacterium]